MKIAVLGATGQLGTDIVFELQKTHEVIPFSHEDMAVENFDDTRNKLSKVQPDCIVNTTAYHNVELCEKNPQQAFLINATALQNLSIVANDLKSSLVHFSTNYVFGGEEQRIPYKESDRPFPINMYGISKLAGEYLIQSYCKKWYIFRVAGLFGKTGTKAKKYKNFIDMMVHLAKGKAELPSSNDEIFTFTSTKDLSEMLAFILPTEQYGLYHATNSGECSRFTFSKEIYRLLNIDCKLNGVGRSYFPTQYKQPSYTVLDNSKLAKIGFKMPHWKDSLKEYIVSSYK